MSKKNFNLPKSKTPNRLKSPLPSSIGMSPILAYGKSVSTKITKVPSVIKLTLPPPPKIFVRSPTTTTTKSQQPKKTATRKSNKSASPKPYLDVPSKTININISSSSNENDRSTYHSPSPHNKSVYHTPSSQRSASPMPRSSTTEVFAKRAPLAYDQIKKIADRLLKSKQVNTRRSLQQGRSTLFPFVGGSIGTFIAGPVGLGVGSLVGSVVAGIFNSGIIPSPIEAILNYLGDDKAQILVTIINGLLENVDPKYGEGDPEFEEACLAGLTTFMESQGL